MSGRDRMGAARAMLRRRLRVLFRLDDVEADLSDELRHHIELETDDLVRSGIPRVDALRQARLRFGGEERVKEEVRDTRGGRILSDFVQDVRYALRGLRMSPGFTMASVLTLALGIGATTAIFSLVYGVLFAPLPFPEPDRLVLVWETSPQGEERNVVSPGNVLDWQARAASFSAMGAYTFAGYGTLTGDGDPVRLRLATVQPSVLRALAVDPVIGRTFTEEDAVVGDALLIGEALWWDRWGGDPSVIGERLVLDDVPYTVVGVMPAGFSFPPGTEAVQLWRPVRRASLDPTSRTSHYLSVVGRLAPDASLESAQAEMSTIAAQLGVEHPAEMTGWGARVVPIREDITRNVASLFWLLLGGVGVVLLVTCANVANLLLSRAVSRQPEIVLRGVLGASRRRLVQQVLTESVVLAAIGCALAFAISPAILSGLVRTAPADVPLLELARIDARMLAFAAAVGITCALVFGLAPAGRFGGQDSARALRDARSVSSRGHVRMRSALLAGQVALSVMLLVGAGLLLRSFRGLQATELGYDADALVLMDVTLPQSRYPDVPTQSAFHDRLIERVESIPGVVSAAASNEPPGSSTVITMSFAIDGRPSDNPSGREDPEVLHAVSPGYFETIGHRVVSGRAFDERDHATSVPTVILNESLARKHFPAGDAIGKRIAFRVGQTPWLEIVGIAEDVRLQSPDVEPEPALFIPYSQAPNPWLDWMTIVVRVEGGTESQAIGPELARALTDMDGGLAPRGIRTVESAIGANLAQRTFAMTLVSGFAVVALVLVLVGLYGLIAYSVARERREIGVRIALGERSSRIVGRVLGRSLLLSAGGVAVGLLAAAGGSRLVSALLYEVSPLDATTYALTAAIVLGVTAATAMIPSLRAAWTDPVLAMRGE